MLKPVYLYQIPKGSKIKVFDNEKKKDVIITFHREDGMYSVCTDEDGQIAHLSAMAPVVKKDNYYELDYSDKEIV